MHICEETRDANNDIDLNFYVKHVATVAYDIW